MMKSIWHFTIYHEETPKNNEIDLFVLTWQDLHGTFLSEKKQVTEQYMPNNIYVKRITAKKRCACVCLSPWGESRMG